MTEIERERTYRAIAEAMRPISKQAAARLEIASLLREAELARELANAKMMIATLMPVPGVEGRRKPRRKRRP